MSKTSFHRPRVMGLISVLLAAVAVVSISSLQAAHAINGATGLGQVKYPSTCTSNGFVYKGDANVGTSGVVKVWWNQATQQNCVILQKTKYVGTPTFTALVLCSTAIKNVSAAGVVGPYVSPQQCDQATSTITDWNWDPADWGNFSNYAGPIVIKAPGCLYVAAFTSSAPHTGSGRYLVSEMKNRESFRNGPGTGLWGCSKK